MNGCPFLASATTPEAVRTPTPPAASHRGEFRPYYSAGLHADLEHRRQHEPVFWCEEIGYWVLTRHADVYSVLHDGVRFSSQNTTRPLNPMHPDAQAIVRDGGYAPTGNHSSLDGDVHRRIRSTTSQVLNLREFVGMHAQVRELVEQAIDRIAHRDTIDLLADFCYELPAQVVFKVLGIPDSDIADVKKWAGARSVIGWRRIALEEVEFSGVKIPKGAPILLSLASANRDEAVFENAQRLDIRRKNARKQLTFGNGVHFCLGAPLARMEMKIVLEQFAIRFPRMRLIEPDAASHMHTFIFRAPDALHVALR